MLQRNLLPLLGCLSILLFGCTNRQTKETTQENEEPTDFYIAESNRSWKVPADEDYLYDSIHYMVSISLELPVNNGCDFEAQLIQKQILREAFGREYITMAPQKAAEAYTGAGDMLGIEGRFTLKDTTLLVYKVERHDEYPGAAHGSYGSKYLVFNAKTGFMETEEDIIEESGTERRYTLYKVRNLLLKYLDPELEVDRDRVWPNGNLRISSEGVTYHYNPYEIAPFSGGEIEIFIPRKDIMKLISYESAVYEYYKNLDK